MTNTQKNSVYNIVAFVFADTTTAQTVYDQVKASAKPENYKVVADAVVVVDEKGKAHIHEGGHGTKGAAGGVVVGGLLSLLGGPIGLLGWAIAGGVIGGFAGKIGGRAIPKKDLEELAAKMSPNTSAILAIVEDKEAEALIDGMQGYNAQVVTLTVGDETSGEIAAAVAVNVEATPATPPTTPSTPSAAPAAAEDAKPAP